jgi:hypothetical protein
VWCLLAYQGVEAVYMPLVADGWKDLRSDVLLPIMVTKNSRIMYAHTDKINSDTCNLLNVLKKDGIESLCVYCTRAVECSADDEKMKENAFEADDKSLKVGWNDEWMTAVRETLHIPIMATFEDVQKRFNGNRFPIQDIAEMRTMKFDRQRIIGNLRKMREAQHDKVKNYDTLQFFVHGKVKPFSDKEFHARIDAAIEILEKFTDEEYAAAISTLKL